MSANNAGDAHYSGLSGLAARERYYPSADWRVTTPAYSLDEDVWGIRYAPTARARISFGLSLLQEWLGDHGIIVDVGGGAGLYSVVLLDQPKAPGRRLIVTDLSITALRLAATRHDRWRSDLQLSQADATRLPFRDSSVDAVICTEVLEHVADDRRAISELHRILRPGGLAYVSVPLEDRATTAWHVRCYDEQNLRARLCSAGFSIQVAIRGGAIAPWLWRSVRYPCWTAWLIGTGNVVRQLRRQPIPSFYASAFCRNIVVPVFDAIARLDKSAARAIGCRFGRTLHCVAKK